VLLAVALSQLVAALMQRQVTYLPLLVVSVFPCLVLTTLLFWREPTQKSGLRTKDFRALGERDQLGPTPPGAGPEGWVTEHGCYLESGTFLAWERLQEPEWGAQEGAHLSVSFRLVFPPRSGWRTRKLPTIAAALLLLGPVASLWFAWQHLDNTGITADFLAVAAFNLLVLGALASVIRLARAPRDITPETRLRVTVNANCLSRGDLEALIAGSDGGH